MNKIIFTFLFLAGNIIAQEYQITNAPVIEYSVDRYTNEIYYRNYITGDIYKTNSTGTIHTLSKFPSVPQFANNSHKAAFKDGNNLYLHDFENDTSYFLGVLPFGYYLLFSPSDNKIINGGGIGGIPLIYYSFEDGFVHNTGITIYYDIINWLTDTTLVYISLGGLDIRVFNINDLSNNVLVPESNLVSILGLANNVDIGAFAYSWEYNSAENTFINLYYPQTNLDTTVYNFQEQGPGQEDYNLFIREVSWWRNKLAFLGEVPLQFSSLIYVYDYTTSQTDIYSDWQVNGDGYKYNLQWLNEDTVIYSDHSDGKLLFGLDVTTPVSVEDNDSEIIVDNFELYPAYPNPFNPSTTISFQLPEQSFISLKVYDVIGTEVETIAEGEYPAGVHEVIFNADNLSSGLYLYRIISGKNELTRKMILIK